VAEKVLERMAEAQDKQMERPPLGLILELPEIELLDAFLRTATTAFMLLVPLMVLLVGSFLMLGLSCCFVWDTSPAISGGNGNCSGWAQAACWRYVSMLRGPKKRDGDKM
jgi:hypothetical protein